MAILVASAGTLHVTREGDPADALAVAPVEVLAVTAIPREDGFARSPNLAGVVECDLRSPL